MAPKVERKSALTSGVHGPVLEVARVRPNAKLPRVLRQKHISGTLFVAQPRARPRSKKLLLPCPLVSARSPRRRRAASWCPRRSGRRKSARSRSEEEPEEGLMPEFLLAKRRRAKDPTLLFSSRYDMMACVDKDKSSSYPERSAGVTGILNTQEGTLV